MAYSAVTQPQPVPFWKPGTLSSTVALQMTRVEPISIRTLPSAIEHAAVGDGDEVRRDLDGAKLLGRAPVAANEGGHEQLDYSRQ
jgi:hypothetical protein